MRGNPQKVINAIDEYGQTKNYLMNVGPSKGEIVSNLVMDAKPETMVELGGYVGYSAILFADVVRKAGGKRYFSLERNPEFAAVIMSLVDLAGLGDVVKVIVGPSDQSLQRLYDNGTLKQIDLMFLDHYKPAYTSDLKLCEHLKLIKPGSVLAADNVIKPGNPPYLEYVRSSVEMKRENANKETNGLEGFSDRYKLQYAKREGDPNLNTAAKGNPNLIYESKLFESIEPTGVPVSSCSESLV
jgi:catechol O-methyltransferase